MGGQTGRLALPLGIVRELMDLNSGSEKSLVGQQLTRTYVALSTTLGGAGLGWGDQAVLVSSRTLGGSAMRAALNSGPTTPVAGVRRVMC